MKTKSTHLTRKLEAIRERLNAQDLEELVAFLEDFDLKAPATKLEAVEKIMSLAERGGSWLQEIDKGYHAWNTPSEAPAPKLELPRAIPTTRAKLEADPRVDSVFVDESPFMRGESYRVLIYLADGYVAEDQTSTLYGRTIREAAQGLRGVTEGEPI
jgi:hypothetical protein